MKKNYIIKVQILTIQDSNTKSRVFIFQKKKQIMNTIQISNYIYSITLSNNCKIFGIDYND